MRIFLLSFFLPLILVMPADINGKVSKLAFTIPYNDALARKKLIYAAGASYGNAPQQCLNKVFDGAIFRRTTEVRCDDVKTDKCSAYAAVSPADKAIILAFRGTNNNIQLLVEGFETVLTYHTPWVSGGAVSQYFNDGFLNIWNGGLKDDFNTLVAKYQGYNLWITGHSLGGAMASLAASYISYNKIFDANKMLVVTFGEPRIGDQSFAASFDKTVVNHFRVTHAHDPVPHLPSKNMEGYTHHKSEVFYKEKMKDYLICDDVDESSFCSNGNVFPDASIKDHDHYFDVNVSELGYSNCANV